MLLNHSNRIFFHLFHFHLIIYSVLDDYNVDYYKWHEI